MTEQVLQRMPRRRWRLLAPVSPSLCDAFEKFTILWMKKCVHRPKSETRETSQRDEHKKRNGFSRTFCQICNYGFSNCNPNEFIWIYYLYIYFIYFAGANICRSCCSPIVCASRCYPFLRQNEKQNSLLSVRVYQKDVENGKMTLCNGQRCNAENYY